MCLFKNTICEYLIINSFKNEESDKTSVDNAHIQGACGGRIDGFTSSECLSLSDY